MAEYSSADKKASLKKAIGSVTLTDAAMPQRYKNLAKCLPCPETSDKPHYTCIYLDVKQAPFLTDYEVDDEVTFVVKAKVVGHNVNESADYECNEYRLEIRKVGKPE